MERNRTAIAKRAALAVAIALVVARVLPALADALNPTPAPTPTQISAPLASSSPSPSPSSGQAPSQATTGPLYPTAAITYKMDNSDTSTPTVQETATVSLAIPAVIKVDPRASSVAITPIHLASSSKLLVCLAASGAQITGIAPSTGLISDSAGGYLMLSGSARDIVSSLSGLRLASNPHVAGASFTFKAVAVSKANTNDEFCGTPNKRQNTRIEALGLGLDTVKVPVKVK